MVATDLISGPGKLGVPAEGQQIFLAQSGVQISVYDQHNTSGYVEPDTVRPGTNV